MIYRTVLYLIVRYRAGHLILHLYSTVPYTPYFQSVYLDSVNTLKTVGKDGGGNIVYEF